MDQCLDSLGTFSLQSAFVIWLATHGSLQHRTFFVTLSSWCVSAARLSAGPIVNRILSTAIRENRVMALTNLVRGSVCLVTVGLWSSGLPVAAAAIIALLSVISFLDQMFAPARMVLTQRNITANTRVFVGTLSFFLLSGIGIVASGVTPTIYSQIEISGCLSLAGILYCICFAIMKRWYKPIDERQTVFEKADESSRKTITATIRYICKSSNGVQLITFGAMGVAFAGGITSQVLSLFCFQALKVQVNQYGLITGSFAAGGLIAFPLTNLFLKRLSLGRLVMASAAGLAVAYGLFGLSVNLVEASFEMLTVGVMFGIYMGVQGPIVQELVPNDWIGPYYSTVSSLTTMSSVLGVAVSYAAQYVGIRHGDLTLALRYSYAIAAVVILLAGSVRGRSYVVALGSCQAEKSE